MRSGSSSNTHELAGGKTTGGGASFMSPRGEPWSTHFEMIAISSSLSDGSGS
jgi:hypothetical protein